MYKYYVDVETLINRDGTFFPLWMHWDGRRFKVEKVISVRETFSKAGGCGICYECRFHGQQRNLFWERNRWFVESEVPMTRVQ